MTRHIWLLALWVVLSIWGQFLVWHLVPDGDGEAVYLYHGTMALRGDIGLYDDELTGHRMPLPYYFFGASQLFGPSLFAGRLLSLCVGLLAIGITARIAWMVGGRTAGVITLCLAATQAQLLSAFAWATFQSLLAVWLSLAVWLLVAASDRSWARCGAMAVMMVACFTRAQAWPVWPLGLGVLLWRSRSRSERWMLLSVATLPWLVFFGADSRHLKLFAWVPLADQMVRSLGYVPINLAYRSDVPTGQAIIQALWVFGRGYKAWLILGGCAVLLAWRHHPRLPRRVWWVTGIALYLIAWQFLIVRFAPRAALGYLPPFLLLLAVPLGCVMAQLGAGRRLLPTCLVALMCLVGPSWSPPSALPLRTPWRLSESMLGQLHARVVTLSTLIPHGHRIFLFGSADAPWLAGLRPYLQQGNHLETLSPLSDDWQRHRSGLWGDAEIREWLGSGGADWALVRRDLLRGTRAVQTTPTGNNVDLIEFLLARNFRVVTVLDHAPGPPLWVFQRLPAPPDARDQLQGGELVVVDRRLPQLPQEWYKHRVRRR